MQGYKYILAANGTTILQAGEMGPLIAEAAAIVKSGDYAHTSLGIFTLTHDFVLPKKPELKVRKVK